MEMLGLCPISCFTNIFIIFINHFESTIYNLIEQNLCFVESYFSHTFNEYVVLYSCI